MTYPLPSCPPAPAGYYFQQSDVAQKLANEATQKVAQKATQKNFKDHKLDNAQQKYADEHKTPVLTDECYCMELLGQKPEGDTNKDLILTRIKCGHFFHAFCLDDWLKKSANSDCPNCRDFRVTELDVDYIMPTAAAIQPPVAQPTSKTAAPKPPVAVTQPKPAEGPGALSICAGTAVSLVKWAYKGLTTESVEATKMRITETEDRLQMLETRWKNMSDAFKTEKVNIAQLIGNVRLSLENHPEDRAEATRCSKVAEKQVETLRKYTIAFEERLENAEKTKKESIKNAEKVLKESIGNAEKISKESVDKARKDFLADLKTIEKDLDIVKK